MPHDGAGGSTTAGGGVPAWISSGILGLLVGAGGTVLGMAGMGYMSKPSALSQPVSTEAPPMNMMGAMMSGQGGRGAPGGGGGGAGGKRALTSFVGKLELLSRPELDLRIELSPEQVAKLAPLLADAAAAETMTGADADSLQMSLEEILTAEQKETLARIALPFGMGGGGGRGAGGGGRGAGGGMMGPPGGGNADENPFAEESAKKRLDDLMSRWKPAS